MQKTHRTPRPVRLAILGALIVGGAFLAAPAVGAAMAVPAAPACGGGGGSGQGGGGGGGGGGCETTTSTTEATTSTTEETTTTTEATTTTSAEVAGETTVPTVPQVAGVTIIREVGVPTQVQGRVTELAATGPTDSPALPLGIVLTLLGAVVITVGVRASRLQRATVSAEE